MLDYEAPPFIDSNYAVSVRQQTSLSSMCHSDRLNVVNSCFLLVPICSAGDCRAFSFISESSVTNAVGCRTGRGFSRRLSPDFAQLQAARQIPLASGNKAKG